MKNTDKLKQMFGIIVAFVLSITITVIGNAAFSDLNSSIKYYDEASRMGALKIISGDDNNLFRPNSKITREQFIVALFKALGKEVDKQSINLNENSFIDVENNRWSHKYIEFALKEGIIRLNEEGIFHPEDEIKFAEACTMALKTVYFDKIENGSWPDNYIEKAHDIGLLKELKMQANDKITRLEASAILDRVWYLNDIKNNNFDYSKIDATQAGTEVIITSDSSINKKLKDYQVQTNKGVYRINKDRITLIPGYSYRVFIYEDNIMAVLDKVSQTDYASIKSSVGSNIRISDFDGVFDGYVIPEKITYYYNGKEITYEQVKDKLEMCASIVFGYNKEKTDYVYAVILDPIYTEPHVVTKYDIENGKAAILKESDNNAIIIRDGNIINFKDLEERDVVYKVTDFKGNNQYFLVINQRIEGKITDIKPNVLAPAIVQINNTDYELGDRFPVKRLNASYGAFSKGAYVQVLMGYDHKVADIYDSAADFGMIINSQIKKSELKAGSKRVEEYFVKMISSDGIVTEYKSDKYYEGMKGKLVNFSFNSNGQIVLENIEFAGMMPLKINKDEKTINERYAADNIKVFNIISNDIDSDSVINTLRWNDLPGGQIPWERVMHMSISGDFEDVVLIVFNDLFEENYSLAYIKNEATFYNLVSGRTSFLTSFYVDGKAYSYSASDKNTSKDEVYRLMTKGTTVSNIVRKVDNMITAEKIDAMDTRRIKLNGKVYSLSDRIKVSSIDKSGTLKSISKDEVDIAKSYSQVSIYLENEFASERVVYLVLKE